MALLGNEIIPRERGGKGRTVGGNRLKMTRFSLSHLSTRMDKAIKTCSLDHDIDSSTTYYNGVMLNLLVVPAHALDIAGDDEGEGEDGRAALAAPVHAGIAALAAAAAREFSIVEIVVLRNNKFCVTWRS